MTSIRAASDLESGRLVRETFVAEVEHYAILPSTQDRARAAAAEPNAILPLLVVANEQTCGRGRGSHRWWTGHGGLAFSLLFDPAEFGLDRAVWPRISLASAVAVVDALQPLVAGQALGLHWPNDVYIGNRKVAGILVDVLVDGKQVLGLGLNSNNTSLDAPAELRDQVVTLLDSTGVRHPHIKLLISLIQQLELSWRQLAADPAQLGRRFDELCLQHGHDLTVRIGSDSVMGRCAGIGPDGALLLDTLAGRRELDYGTLH